MLKSKFILSIICFLFYSISNSQHFEGIDVFSLEYVSSMQVSPDGKEVLYLRNFKDIMTDRNLSNIWLANIENKACTPITSGMNNDYSPLWMPDGQSLIYMSNKSKKSQIYRHWLASGRTAILSNLETGAANLSISPDGQWIAFSMAVPNKNSPLAKMPVKPEGANWNEPPLYFDNLKYQSDGRGFLKDEYRQLFLISTDGGSAIQLSHGRYHHNGPFSWTPDSKQIYFGANPHINAEMEPRNSEVCRINVESMEVEILTDRFGPDGNAQVSPDGRYLAYTGFDDKFMGYANNKIYLKNLVSGDTKLLLAEFDRSIGNIQWAGNDKIAFQYDDKGRTKIAHTDLTGTMKTHCDDVGGLTLGRPYSAGYFHMGNDGVYAYTLGTTQHPADLAVGNINNGKITRLTELNADLFKFKELGQVEEMWVKSSFDGREIQAWICKPPGFDPNKKYPLLLEIHGGPFANYGERFSAEVQLYAAAGYVVLYTNPRGSTSYGDEFANLIHHNYPGQDFDDLMSCVDAVVKKGYIDEGNMMITGGSGGGVLSAWSIGKTDRFKAAVVAKPVINWYSFVLHADNPAFFTKYWFPAMPWEDPEHYLSRSPISYVGNVTTPTMLLTGEEDLRTPMSESEQFYSALQLQGVPSSIVRIPGAYHGIAAKPSNLIAKVNYILAWFDKYKNNQP